MVQHQLLLAEVRGTVGALEHGDPATDDVLVEVSAEQRLQREHRVAHGTLVDHPVGREKGHGERGEGPTMKGRGAVALLSCERGAAEHLLPARLITANRQFASQRSSCGN